MSPGARVRQAEAGLKATSWEEGAESTELEQLEFHADTLMWASFVGMPLNLRLSGAGIQGTLTHIQNSRVGS